MQVWQAMEAEVARGGVHMLGVSNCYALHQLQKLWSDAVVKPRVLQNRCLPPCSDQMCAELNHKPLILMFLLQGSTKTRLMTKSCARGAKCKMSANSSSHIENM